jgi:hypothetical protein
MRATDLQIKMANVGIHLIVEGHRLMDRGDTRRGQELANMTIKMEEALQANPESMPTLLDSLWAKLVEINPKLGNVDPSEIF